MFGFKPSVLDRTAFAPGLAAEDAKIVLIAGQAEPSQGGARVQRRDEAADEVPGRGPGVKPVFVAGGWPADESVFDGAKAVVFFMDGGGGHPIVQGDHLAKIAS